MIDRALINDNFDAAFKDAQRVEDVQGISNNYARIIGCYEALILSLVRDKGDAESVLGSINRLRQRMAGEDAPE